MKSAAQDRAEGVIAALEREASRASEPWLTPASIRVLAEDNRALLDEIERLRAALVRVTKAPQTEMGAWQMKKTASLALKKAAPHG